MTYPSSRRKRRLILPHVQVRLIAAFAGVTILALLAQFLVLGSLLSETANGLPSGGPDLVDRIPGILGRTLLASLGIVLPAIFLIGMRVTFRLAGPIYRFEQHLGAVARGEETRPVQIRQGDQLQELCGLINAALAREHGRGVAEGLEQAEAAKSEPARSRAA